MRFGDALASAYGVDVRGQAAPATASGSSPVWALVLLLVGVLLAHVTWEV